MPRVLGLRHVSNQEAIEIRALAISWLLPERIVKRARIIQALLDNPRLTAGEAGKQAGYRSHDTGRKWVKRFNKDGIPGLKDRPRSGHPVTHNQAVRASLVRLALQNPRSLGYHFERWTLERLRQVFEARCGVRLADSTISNWLNESEFRWKRYHGWLHAAKRYAPEFMEHRRDRHPIAVLKSTM